MVFNFVHSAGSEVENLSSPSTVEYSCTLTPLFSIELLSNQSYIVQLNFAPPLNASDDMFGITEQPARINSLDLTVIVEDEGFHAALFYLKCLCVPFILGTYLLSRDDHILLQCILSFIGALVMFCIRLYLNDLYVAIPDRLLITCALAQVVQNVPVEALISEGSMWVASPHLKLLDDFSKFTLMSCLFLFWLIYTKDKVRATYSTTPQEVRCIQNYYCRSVPKNLGRETQSTTGGRSWPSSSAASLQPCGQSMGVDPV
jgi:hypothetical protein